MAYQILDAMPSLVLRCTKSAFGQERTFAALQHPDCLDLRHRRESTSAIGPELPVAFVGLLALRNAKADARRQAANGKV